MSEKNDFRFENKNQMLLKMNKSCFRSQRLTHQPCDVNL